MRNAKIALLMAGAAMAVDLNPYFNGYNKLTERELQDPEEAARRMQLAKEKRERKAMRNRGCQSQP